MIAPISGSALPSLPDVGSIKPTQGASGDFQAMLESYIGHVQKSQDAAQSAVTNFLGGGDEELHSVALASQRAELEFEMFLQVRNKIVSAYQEVMRMQV
ncbi:MAG TPA: flagellar hook-basal body complex protein FliE [Bryobacteraceae bacterium]|nr:flagellar hook-basal body complex protein FliE [Bryobacteraceae bacterium]